LKQPAILVFDIGKTAKKVLLFDRLFHVLEENVEHFAEIKDDDGFPSEDLAKVSDWVKAMVDRYIDHSSFEVTHINFSGYGASLVHLDKEGNPLPFYNYLKPFPDWCREEFLSTHDKTKNILASTASPWLGMLNSGLQLYWIKREKSSRFRNIKTSLHFPQYFPFLLTKEKFCEMTSVGCHTMLWDFQKNDYHDWVKQEGLADLFPPCKVSTHTTTFERNGKKVTVGIGVHDSSAALMPYLVTQHEPFLLLSTGTWNITFNPFNDTPLSQKELDKDCLCYLTFEGKPVKASRIFLGHEHEMQVNELASYFKLDISYFANIRFSQDIFEKLVKEKANEVFPVGMEGSGPIPEKQIKATDWSSFANADEAYHQLVRYLVKWQLMSIELINPAHKVKHLIIVGGFTRNQLFLEILKREAKDLILFLSDHPRAAAMGAAWLVCGKEAYEGKKDLLNVIPF
jgi:sugar (pentulose or hexulose) kinase